MKQIFLVYVLILTTLFSCGEYNKQERPEKSLKEDFELTRNNKNQLVFKNNTDKNIGIFTEDGKELTLKNGTIQQDLGIRPILKVVSQNETFYVAERGFLNNNIHNLQDLGGIKNKDGQQIKWGTLFRSGKLSDYTKKDEPLAKALHLKTICDFRQANDVKEEPDNWFEIDKINQVSIPIGDPNFTIDAFFEEISQDGFVPQKMMQNANKEFAMDYQEEYKKFFQVLLNQDNYPMLYHCSAGKDRTGFATALLLSVLDVDRKTIIDSYLLTNYYFHDFIEENLQKVATYKGVDESIMRPLMGVEKSYIETAFKTIEDNYGTVENYLCKVLNVCDVEVEKLKKMLLYKASPCANTLGIDLPSNCNEIEVKRPFEGVKNFREILVPENSTTKIKENQIFRSDALQDLTDADVKKMEAMGIKTIVDFRSPKEISRKPNKEISGVNTLNISMGRDPAKFDTLLDKETYEKIKQLYLDGKIKEVDSIVGTMDVDLKTRREGSYRRLALGYMPQYSKFMKLLADENNYPIVFHCQGGRGRTGIASAIILKLLEADDKTVINDYLATNLYDYDKVEKQYLSGAENLKANFGAKKFLIETALKAIIDEYGSFNNYLKKGLNLSEEEIKAIKNNLKQ